MMKKTATALLGGLVLLALAVHAPVFAKTPLRVTFVSPSYPGSNFWDRVGAVMQVAADDLGVELQVLHASKDSNIDRMRHLALVEEVAASSDPPDYLLTIFRKGTAMQVLETIERNGLKTFIFNTDVPSAEAAEVGVPRQRFSHWIGHLYPDDEQVGYDLARVLFERARAASPDRPGPLEVIGISGNPHSVPALKRNEGLERALRESGGVLRQLVFGHWNRGVGREQTAGLLRRYPDVAVVWAASDSLALGARDGVRDAGLAPGRDVMVGGVDWFPEALSGIDDGTIAASAGGHFVEGALALVMLYDHHHGVDFAASGSASFKTPLLVLGGGEGTRPASSLAAFDWTRVDFRRFSKALNADSAGPYPTPAEILQGLGR